MTEVERLKAEVERLTRELTGVRESLAERQSAVEDLEATLAMRTGQLQAARQQVEQRDAELKREVKGG
jgi:uncharacterized protein (DUF3084 family)